MRDNSPVKSRLSLLFYSLSPSFTYLVKLVAQLSWLIVTGIAVVCVSQLRGVLLKLGRVVKHFCHLVGMKPASKLASKRDKANIVRSWLDEVTR